MHQTGPGPYGPLLPPDANGIMLPAGFTSRVIARSGEPVGSTGYVWPWFPDGGAIAFASRREGRSSIWRVPKLGGSPALLVPDASAPAISPDGKRLAFLRADRSGNERIAVAPLDEPEAFVWWSPDETPAWQLRDLAWSPDSATLAYSDGRDLWLSRSGGTAPRRLTRERAADLRAKSLYGVRGTAIPLLGCDAHRVRRNEHEIWLVLLTPELERAPTGAG